MIIGQYTSKLTDKERLAVPKKFRGEIGEKLIVAKWYEKCLVLVSKDSWNDLLSRIGSSTDLVVIPVRDIDRFVKGSAFEVNLDSQGRFIVPEILRTYAEIKDEVVFVGLGDRIEIWSKEVWDEMEKVSETKATKALEKIAN